MMGQMCQCSSPDCRQFGCQIMRRQMQNTPTQVLPQQAIWNQPHMPAVYVHPRGCVCPPGSEKTCEGIGCPRQNPLKPKQ